MKKLHHLRLLAVTLLLLTFLPALSARAQTAENVNGTWNFTVETSGGSGTPTITLKQEGEKLTGTYKGQLGEAPVTGTLKEKEIKFEFTVSGQGQTVKVEYTGTVEGTTMQGRVKLGELGEGTFTAKRQ